jgi:hypothetical protein
MKKIDVIKRLVFSPGLFNKDIKLPEGSKFLHSVLVGDMVYVLYLDSIVDEAEKVAPDPIIEVYNKFKHLKELFNDENWLDMDNNIHKVFYECWQGIEKYAEGKEVK